MKHTKREEQWVLNFNQRFEVLTTVFLNITAFWKITLRSLSSIYQTTCRHIPQEKQSSEF
jgi:hypothetical protein